MKLIVLLCYTFAFNLYAEDCGNKTPNFCQAKLVSVYDGDTFKVTIPKLHKLFGEKLSIRVKGVDTPELRGSEYEKAMGKKAKAFTKSFLESAKRIDLKNCVRGKYFRIVCDVYADGKNLTKELIKNDLGIVYPE
jgi:endonuclease YncB( thermonuclease family)